MKVILITALTVLSLSAHAGDVIKPINSRDEAKGVVDVDSVKYNYSILDRGWTISGTFENGKASIKAEKSFLLDYTSQKGELKKILPSAGKSLDKDATAKCSELGELELNDEKNKMADMPTQMTAEIVNGKAKHQDDGSMWGRYVCIVKISAKN